MTRLVAMLAGLLAITMVALALSAPTAWLLLTPTFGMFVSVVCTGAVLDGFDGRPEPARRWGVWSLVATAAVCGALEVGAQIRGEGLGYWSVPWLCTLAMAWVPPVVAGIMGTVGVLRRRQLHRRAVRLRRSSAEE